MLLVAGSSTTQSLPTWECGLKLSDGRGDRAPFYHSPRGSADWNRGESGGDCVWNGHSPRGSVDWNRICSAMSTIWWRSLPLWECGLKCMWCRWVSISRMSLPTREHGLKFFWFCSSVAISLYIWRNNILLTSLLLISNSCNREWGYEKVRCFRGCCYITWLSQCKETENTGWGG